MINTENSHYTSIPINYPSSFQYFVLSMQSQKKIEPIIDNLDKGKAEIVFLTKEAQDRFFSLMEHCNLSEVEKELLSRTESIMQVYEKTDPKNAYQNLFHCLNLAISLRAQLSETALILDIEQGTILKEEYNPGLRQIDTPLAEDFVLIKGFEDVETRSFFLVTEGLLKFGLPEIALPKVPTNLGADGAYLVRTVAQYLLTRMQHCQRENLTLRVNKSLEISATYCELTNPQFAQLDNASIHTNLKTEIHHGQLTILLDKTEGFEDYFDWLIATIDNLTQIRKEVHSLESNNSKVVA